MLRLRDISLTELEGLWLCLSVEGEVAIWDIDSIVGGEEKVEEGSVRGLENSESCVMLPIELCLIELDFWDIGSFDTE